MKRSIIKDEGKKTHGFKRNAGTECAVATRIEGQTIIDLVLAIDSVVTERTVTGVVVGQQSHRIEKIRTVGAVAARLVGASDDAWLLAINADVIFRTVTEVTANQILAGGVVLTRVRLAFVYVFVAPVQFRKRLKFHPSTWRRIENLQPSGPSSATLAGVIGYTVDTFAVDAQVLGAFVNVDLAKISFVAGQAIAGVIGQRIQAFGPVVAFVVVTQSALQFQRFQLDGADWSELASRRSVQQFGS